MSKIKYNLMMGLCSAIYSDHKEDPLGISTFFMCRDIVSTIVDAGTAGDNIGPTPGIETPPIDSDEHEER